MNKHDWLRRAGIIDLPKGEAILHGLAELPFPVGFLDSLFEALPEQLRLLSDSLGSLSSLCDFLAQQPLDSDRVSSLVEKRDALPRLLRALDLGSEPRQWLITGSAILDFEAAECSDEDKFQALKCSVASIINSDQGRSQQQRALQRVLRSRIIDIAIGHFWQNVPIEETLLRISNAAEATLQPLFQACFDQLVRKFGQPCRENDLPASISLLALAELGGQELCFETPLSLMMVANCDGKTNASRSISNRQFFERFAHEFVDSLNGATADKPLFVVKWIDDSSVQGNFVVRDTLSTIRSYESTGRTWQRQAFIRARPIAGDMLAGQAFIQALQSWIYRRYIVDADIAGTAILRRKVLRQLLGKDLLRWDPSDPEQGVQLITRTVQILQLTHGFQDEALRTRNTFEAITRLESATLLSEFHAAALYDSLQKLSSQMFASRLDLRPSKEGRYHHRRQQSAASFDMVKSHAFDILRAKDKENDYWPTEESDLVLDPSPPRAWVAHVLRKYKLSDPQTAYDLLNDMSQEEVSILSTRRCRHQLAAIAPSLLEAVAKTPAPMTTLHNLNRITQSIGGKRVLWQLFAENQATMNAVVKLCAASPYLTSQLTQTPGMLDELIDSLLLGRLPAPKELHETYAKWHFGEDSDTAIGEFKRSFQLRIGIRDLLNKSDVCETQQALSEIADTIVQQTMRDAFSPPVIGQREKPPAPKDRFALFAIDRYGDQQLGYRDALTMLLIYENTTPVNFQESSQLPQHLFDRLGQTLLQNIQRQSAGERLYDAYLRWGPMQGKSHLAINFDDLIQILNNGSASIQDKTQLASLRFLAGDAKFGKHVSKCVASILKKQEWQAYSQMVSALLTRVEEQDRHTLGHLRDLAFAVSHLPDFDPGGKAADDTLRSLKSGGELHRADLALRRLDMAFQLSRKSSDSDLPRDDEGRRRLNYLLGLTCWDDTNERLRTTIHTYRQHWEVIVNRNSSAMIES